MAQCSQQLCSSGFAVDAVNAGADKPVGKWFVPLGKYVLVPLSLVALIAGALLGGIG